MKVKQKDEEVLEENSARITVETFDLAWSKVSRQTYDTDEDVVIGEDKRLRKDKLDFKWRVIVSGKWFGHTCPNHLREEDEE